MTTTLADSFRELEMVLQDAKGIAWDTCHKIYVLMDDAQMEQMKEYEYDPLISSDEMTPDEMFKTVVNWYTESCGLKFVQMISTFPNGEQDFHEIVEQFAYDEEDEEE